MTASEWVMPPTETPTVDASPELVNQISTSLGDQITDEQVNLVLAALNAARSGAALGTILRDPASGAVAHRVDHVGVHLWRVTAVDGTKWDNTESTLPGWDVLYAPPEVS